MPASHGQAPRLVSAAGAEPVGEAEFAALMAPLGPYGPDDAAHPVCVAVSGGGDSMALAVLAQRWRRHVLALVVDHALRTESADEARLTCQRLAEWGIPARQLTLAPLRPGSVQERARDARLGMLEEACVQAGASVLLLAHHEADQEETLWMRWERHSGRRGLCGMAGRTLRGRVAFLRPLLGVRPERLRATLIKAGLAWCEDPSNQNRRFRRVAVRQDLQAGQRQQMRTLRQEACAIQREEEIQLARLMAEWVEWQPEGWLRLSPACLAGDLPADVAAERGGNTSEQAGALCDALLGRLVRLVGGHEHEPSRQAVTALRRVGHGALGRACLRPSGGGAAGWMLYREARNLAGVVPAVPGQCWDGRWRYLGGGPEGAVIGALGRQASALRVGRAVPACILPALPVLRVGARVVAVPEGARGLTPALPRVSFVREAGTPATAGRDW